MQLVVAGCLFCLGWISGRFQRWSDEYLAIVLVAVAGSAIAISRGGYEAIFDPADPFSRADNLFFGLTPNQIAATMIDAGAFLGGAIMRQRRTENAAKPLRSLVTATCNAYRRSRFAHCVIKNNSPGKIGVTYIEVLPVHGRLFIEASNEGEVEGNIVKMTNLLSSGESLTIEILFADGDLKNLAEMWLNYIDHTATVRRLLVQIVEKG